MGKKHDKGLENFLLLHGNFAPKSYNRRKKHEQHEYIKLFRCVQKRSQQNYQLITRASHIGVKSQWPWYITMEPTNYQHISYHKREPIMSI